MHPILIPLVYGPAPRVPVTNEQRIGIMIDLCSSMIRNTSPRPCPVLLVYPHYAP